MSSGDQRIKWCRNTAEYFNRLSRVHERYRRQTDARRQIANMNMSSRSLKRTREELQCQCKLQLQKVNIESDVIHCIGKDNRLPSISKQITFFFQVLILPVLLNIRPRPGLPHHQHKSLKCLRQIFHIRLYQYVTNAYSVTHCSHQCFFYRGVKGGHARRPHFFPWKVSVINVLDASVHFQF